MPSPWACPAPWQPICSVWAEPPRRGLPGKKAVLRQIHYRLRPQPGPRSAARPPPVRTPVASGEEQPTGWRCCRAAGAGTGPRCRCPPPQPRRTGADFEERAPGPGRCRGRGLSPPHRLPRSAAVRGAAAATARPGSRHQSPEPGHDRAHRLREPPGWSAAAAPGLRAPVAARHQGQRGHPVSLPVVALRPPRRRPRRTRGQIVALAADAPTDLCAYRPRGSVVYVLGNETDGVSPAVSALAQRRVRIPMANGVESLNVAVTAALIAFRSLLATPA